MVDRMDDGWDTFCVTDTDTQTQTHTDARTFFSRHLMVCRARFTIGPFGAIIHKTLCLSILGSNWYFGAITFDLWVTLLNPFKSPSVSLFDIHYC